ncbi:CD276 antigen-like [Poecilia reticulata]|uniref:CD276 antigen-like n=1 Tax=Poecilia reticulata TaxID=8081 RepID=UPI0007EBCAF5|nr:PREDICTED: CD276 antigen-like [Poecilia reticulata]
MRREHYGVKIFVILVITECLFFSFSSSDSEMSCHFMQSCILPCSLDNGDELIIHWFYMKGDLNVHSFYQNQDQLGNQNQRFRNRTSLFKDQIPRNNFSLKLTGVKLQDEGRYHCLKSSTKGFNELFINLKVDAPVSDIRIHQDGNRITCSSEGIYPQPELTWSTEPPSSTTLNETTRIQKTEDQLYNVSSSLTGPDGPDRIYSCSIRTRRNQRRATFREQSVTSAPYRTTTLHCSDSNSSAASLVWRFNDQIILSQTEPSVSPRVSEAWRKHVKVESRSGSLTLQDMTSQREGVYTCELSNKDETIITKTCVRINQESRTHHQISIIIGVVVVVGVFIVAAIIIWKKCCRNAGGA